MHNKKSGLGNQAAPDIESCKAGHDLQVNVSVQGNSYAKTPRLQFSSAFVAMMCDRRHGCKGDQAGRTLDFLQDSMGKLR